MGLKVPTFWLGLGHVFTTPGAEKVSLLCHQLIEMLNNIEVFCEMLLRW